MHLPLIFITALLIEGQSSKPPVPYVIHAPVGISSSEHDSLVAFGLSFASKASGGQDTEENSQGDLAVRVKNRGVMIVSRESELMRPIRLFREMFQLSKVHGENDLIPFSELSESAKKQFQDGLYWQYPLYDLAGDSCFSLQVMYGLELRSPKLNYSSATAPQRFGGDRDKLASFRSVLVSKGLVISRKEDELPQFIKKLSLSGDQVLFDPTQLLKTKIELDRYGLEIFQGWADFTLHQIDEQIYSKYSSDSIWSKKLQSRGVKTMDELQRIAPSEYQTILSNFEANYKFRGLSSREEAREELSKASIGYHFRFTILSALRDSKQLFVFESRW